VWPHCLLYAIGVDGVSFLAKGVSVSSLRICGKDFLLHRGWWQWYKVVEECHRSANWLSGMLVFGRV
jgi:hypothetical protein